MDANGKVPPVEPVTDPHQNQPKPDTTPSHDQQSLAALQNIPAYITEPIEYRLVVDKDPVSNTFIYRTVDRLTGETVAQYPNEEIVRLRDSAGYKPGTVFDGKV
jgi:hypothetical protein